MSEQVVDLPSLLTLNEEELLKRLGTLSRTPEVEALVCLYALQRAQVAAEGKEMERLTKRIEWLTTVLAALTAVGTGFAIASVLLAATDAAKRGQVGEAYGALIVGLIAMLVMGSWFGRGNPDLKSR